MKEVQGISPLLHPFELPTRTERRDAMEHRQRILEAARHLFREYGVDAVSMHQIAKAAHIGQGTLYRRYASKGELCLDLLRDSHEHFVEEVATLLSTQETMSALQQLDAVLTKLVQFMEGQGALLASAALDRRLMLVCESGSVPQTVSQNELHRVPHRPPFPHDPFQDWLYQLVIDLLTRAVEQQELAPLDIAFTADAVLGTLHPIIYRFQRQERGYSPERILQGLRHIYIEGISAS